MGTVVGTCMPETEHQPLTTHLSTTLAPYRRRRYGNDIYIYTYPINVHSTRNRKINKCLPCTWLSIMPCLYFGVYMCKKKKEVVLVSTTIAGNWITKKVICTCITLNLNRNKKPYQINNKKKIIWKETNDWLPHIHSHDE